MADNAILQLKDANGTYPLIDFMQPLGYTESGFPNPERDSNIYTLSMVPGTWTSTDIDDNRVREEFEVFGKEVTTSRIRYAVRTVSTMLQEATRLNNTKSFGNEIRLWYRAEGENDTRAAFVYSGSIREVDQTIVRRGIKKYAGIYKITIVRDMYWEHQSKDSSTGGTWLNVSTHGGTALIPISSFPGDVDGRVSVFRIASDGGSIKKVWLGIKDPVSGLLNTRFDPEIKVVDAHYIIGNNSGVIYPYGSTDDSFLDDQGLLLRFLHNEFGYIDYSDWRYRVSFQITKWNSKTANSANLDAYFGSYYLLLRYKTTDIGEAKIGIRAATGYRYLSNLSPMDRIYLDSTHNGNESAFQYVNLGRFTIGGENWTQEMRSRIAMEGFRIYLEMALIDGDFQKDQIYLDNMYLVPADHYLEFDLDEPYQGFSRAEIYQHIDNSVSGFIVTKTQDGVDIPLNTREVRFGITELNTESWGWPTKNSHQPIMVLVADREENKTKSVSAKAHIDAGVARRSLGYSS